MSNTNTNRKRRSSEANPAQASPSAKKPKIDSMYTRTDPKTGELGRLRRKDDNYWKNFTRRAKRKREKREARKKKDAAAIAKKKQERAERRKKREAEKKKKSATKTAAAAEVSSSESEVSEDELEEVKLDRGDKTTFVPFHKKTARFKDNVVVVTGGGRGIGQACALRLAQEGAVIYVLDNTRFAETVKLCTTAQKELHDAKYKSEMTRYHAEKSRNQGVKKVSFKPTKVKFKARAIGKKCDVTDAKQVEAAIAQIVKERGYIDVLLNCINTTGKDYGDTKSHEVKLNSFDRIMKLNLYSVVNASKAVIPYMLQEEYGRIINLAALDGKSGAPKCLAFAAAKAGVINVTKTMGQEYAGTGITVNCIAPQYDEYHFSEQKMGKKKRAKLTASVPMKREIFMEELAGAVAFVASEENTYTTGFCYDLSGGTCTY